MLRKKSLLTFGVVFLGLLLLFPVTRIADARDGVSVKISTEMEKQLSAAGPNEIVTAMVKMREVGPPARAQGSRSAVFAQLRTNAQNSQADLVSFLSQDPRVTKVRQFWIDNLVLVKAPKDVIAQIAGRADVVEVFENFTVTLPPAEKRAGAQRASAQSQTQLWDNISKIGAKDVWTSYGLRGAGVRVGGLDTGVDISHPDLAGKMVTDNPADPTYPGGWAEFDGDGNMIPGSVPHDSDTHGTHTSGTMVGGNASGWDVGVAPDANLMHGLVIPGGSGSFAQVAGGMEWIIDPDGNPMTDDGAQVVNMSLGATGTHEAMVVPTDNMVAAGVFPSFSIGNAGPGSGTTGSPGNVPSACGVGATDSLDVIAGFSSRGPVTWTSPPLGTFIKPDMSAPGVKVYSTVPGAEWQWNDGVLDWSGTSMAAPHLAGTVALMLQANPSLTVQTAKQLLAQTAIDLGDPGKDNTYGYGRVNAFAAVSAALAGVGTLQGTVYSSAGGTVENAEILVVDTGQRVFSDATGQYTIQLVAGDQTIEVSRFGYDTFSTLVTVVADQTTTQDVTLNQLPSGTIAGNVTDAVTGDGIAASVNVLLGGDLVLSTSTDPITGAYSVVAPIGTYDLVFGPTFPYPVTLRNDIDVFENTTTTVDVALMAAQILIVDDDGGDAYETYFEQAVLGAGRSYLTVTTPPAAAEMTMFEAVIWLTGDDYTTTLTSTDQAELATFLDGGGRLFISGQDIGYDIRTEPFYANYLHATYVQDDVNLGGVLGNPLNPVGVGFGFDIKGGTGANNQAYPSEMDAIPPAMAAFFYDENVPAAASTSNTMVKNSGVGADAITSSGGAGLTFEGAYRLVYFSFGFEAIAGDGDRAALMDRILDWLQGFPEIVHTPLGDTENTTDPYRVVAVITSDFFPLDPSSFAVVYNTGGPDFTIAMTATGMPDEYEAFIPPQPGDTDVYYYITAADIEGHASTDPIGAPVNRHHFRVAPDEEPPVIVHVPLTNTNDLTGPYAITAEVTDNIGVESVYLLYAKNMGLYHRVKMLWVTGDTYQGEIPGPSEVGDIYNYYLYAMDESHSGNITRDPAMGTYEFEIVEEFVWDFETDDGGFTQAGDVWEWGAPTSGPGGAYSGTNLWATVLDANYPSSADATLDVPTITLAADKPFAFFSFWHWYNMENRFDGGNVKVSADGGMTWDILTPAGGYDDVATSGNAGIPGEACFTDVNEFWQEEVFDLSAYAGQAVVIRFHFGSDGSVTRAGWYVDYVRLGSSDVDNVPPSIANTQVPPSTFDTAGPYTVTTSVTDLFSGVNTVSMFYSFDEGVTFTEAPMTNSSGDEWTADIPGQANGTRIQLYIQASDLAGNVTVDPATAPTANYAFAILPSAPTLVIVASSGGVTVEEFRAALEANGHEADYWYQPTQGNLSAAELQLYKTIILDERGSLTSTEQANLAAFLESGTQASKKHLFLLGRDLAFFSSTRPWIAEYMRADYVQDDPDWREITGEPGDPIGIGETLVISGSFPDEVQRSETYPGGIIVYKYTGLPAALSRPELEGAYVKAEKEWDGVMPHQPSSLDAAAGIRYIGDTYKSVYFTFNFDYIQEFANQAGISDRVLNWVSAPDIVHMPLPDTEDTLTAYTATALVFSEDLDPSRVRLIYDVGAGPVTIGMTPTGNPDEFSGDIPPQTYGTSVSYYLSAANFDGTTSYDPAGAPVDQHTFEVTADNQAPVIVHTPLQYSADVAGPYTISAMITDNVGVDPNEVFVTYSKNGGTSTTLPMMDLGGDMYSADIPGPSVVGDLYDYFILARDVATIPNTARDPLVGTHTFEIVDFFVWDFEGDNGGFAAGGPDWEWGTATSGPSDAHSGVNLWATKLGADYSSSSNSTLDSPPVIVPSGSTFASLSYWQWYNMETNYDGGNVKISTDGGATWTILMPDIGYNGTALSGNAAIPGEPCFTGSAHQNWEQVMFDLSAYKGQSVILRWHFGSDSSVQRVGWYIDDVVIEGAEDTEAPVFVSTTVPAGTFDTVGPYTITSEVLDALTGVASCMLYYSTDDGSTWTTVMMSATGNPDEYSGDVPGQASGTRIKIYVEATDNASNTSTDPGDAPTTTYEFGIMPSGDYLVLLGGASHTSPTVFQQAFSDIGRTADVWDWDDLGVPTVAILLAYQTVIIDESWYLDGTQQDTLGAFLSVLDADRQQIFMMGRDMSFGSSARPWMEQYTGSSYVQDDPSWRQLTGAPSDPIGAGETFTISGSYPDEIALSTTYPGGFVVYRYSGPAAANDAFDDAFEFRAFYEKAGKVWDPRLVQMVPSGPDSAAAVRYVGTTHASVYFTFQFNYIQEDTRRADILERALDWLAAQATGMGPSVASEADKPAIPSVLTLGQNYPNPFNPVTRIDIGVPEKHNGNISLKIYNVKGQLVKNLFAGTKTPGYHTFTWDATNDYGTPVSTGIYFANFVAGDTRMTRKMVLLK